MFDYQNFLPRYIAGGNPSNDTLTHYNAEIDNFLNWCNANSYDALKDIEEAEAFQYLDYLSKEDYSAASINLKICAARTFYFVAIRLKIISFNPFDNVKPKKPAYDDGDIDYFTMEELKEICTSILNRDDPTAKRDLAIFMLMSVEGLRTVEIHRLNDKDIFWDKGNILDHGKGKDSYIYPCQDSLDILKSYIETRPEPITDEQGKPTFIGYSQKFFGQRISRNGIRWSINHILLTAGKKEKGRSCHTLRHSCGTNLYEETKDLRLVQETLRHTDPQTTSRYAHIVNRKTERKTAIISPVKDKK